MTTQPTTTPHRVQRTRTAGQPGMPPGAIYVGRGTRWGNPYRVDQHDGHHIVRNPQGGVIHAVATATAARAKARARYRDWLNGPSQRQLRADARTVLAGCDLACWCPEGEPCHADVLLKLANSAPASSGSAAARTPGGGQ